MDAIDRKLIRDFKRLWTLGVAIAFVLGAGTAIIIMAFGMSQALFESREAYSTQNNFADIFASAKRARNSLVREIESIPGVKVLVLLGQPLGWWIGTGIARFMIERFSSDIVTMPLMMEPSTFAQASLIVILASTISTGVVIRRLGQLELIEVMKTRE